MTKKQKWLIGAGLVVTALAGTATGQIVGLQQVPVLDYLGYPTTSITNPSTGRGRVFYSTTDNTLHCLNSDGSSCAFGGGGGGTVTSIATTSPITGGTITTTGTIACPTCTTSAAAITNNVVPKGSGGAQGLTNSSITDNGTTVSTTETVTVAPTANSAVSLNLKPTTGTGNPFVFCSQNSSGTCVFTTDTNGFAVTSSGISSPSYQTNSNCSSSASPAVCGGANAGSVAIPAGALQTLVVNTGAVTANSQIILQIDEGLGTKLGVTCNTATTITHPVVTARTAATSFTIEELATTTTNPVCVSYMVFN